MISALDIHVTGIVQGVGFRPFVYRLARRHVINGWVLNSADGVHINAEGEDNNLDAFCLALANDAPPAANVEQVEMHEIPLQHFKSFEIRFSKDENMGGSGKGDDGVSSAGLAQGEKSDKQSGEKTLVSADLAICTDCVRELFDKDDRRYRYPFINCTNCGPRFTIISELPYDRCYTSMKAFEMCPTCAAEYANPLDRRFHAQPDACFECGPHITWREKTSAKDGVTSGGDASSKNKCTFSDIKIGTTLKESDAIFAGAVRVLIDGGIIAVKGLGGFHLACDGRNSSAVKRLRKLKQRSNKAFAIMTGGLEYVRTIAHVNPTEEDLLTGCERPIVLLRKKAACENDSGAAEDSTALAPEVTMGLPEIGVMLPYTPVQHILMNDFCEAGGHYIVMTSGNLYDNPICIDDNEAAEKLGEIADAILGNDRAILTRYDDSVVRVIDAAGSPAVQMLRRARGYAPVPIKLAVGSEAFLQKAGDIFVAGSEHDGNVLFAAGPEQKNTFAYLRPAGGNNKDSAEVFVSQHIGDLENAEVMDAWNAARQRMECLFDFTSGAVAYDPHPEYLSTKWVQENFIDSADDKQDKKLFAVQHHFAHIASVMAENNLAGPVAGFAFDGTGYGADKNVWGGEILLCNNRDYERFANFCYMPMPGVGACVKNPTQMAAGVLWGCDLLEHPYVKEQLAVDDENFSEQKLANLCKVIESGSNVAYTSSVGRLFDAASALTGVCSNSTYEGEAAIMLEAELQKLCSTGPASAATTDKSAQGTSMTSPTSTNTNNTGLYNPDPRYTIAITKNSATEGSTAHDTSVLLLDAAPAFKALLDDMAAGVSKAQISLNFHNAFVECIITCAKLINQMYGIRVVALSGGCFMNRYLLEAAIAELTKTGFNVALNREVPCNDGGVSLGQLAVAANQN